jgi:hypothetical protein
MPLLYWLPLLIWLTIWIVKKTYKRYVTWNFPLSKFSVTIKSW